MKSKKPALIGLGLAIAAMVGYAGYAEHDKRAQERAIVALVSDTTEQLRAAFGTPPRAPAEPLARVEGHLGSLQALNATRASLLAGGAELYIVSARELLRRRQASALLEQRALESRSALAAHMASARHRSATWIQDAATLKRKVEAEHSELQRMLTTLEEQLETLPAASKRLAPHVERRLLLEEAVRAAAQRQVSEALARTEKALAQTRRLGAS